MEDLLLRLKVKTNKTILEEIKKQPIRRMLRSSNWNSNTVFTKLISLVSSEG